MPAKSTVRSWVAECEIVPGINDVILKKIGEETSNETYINFREYPHSDPEAEPVKFLIIPTEQFAKVVSCQLEAFDKIHSKFWDEHDLLLKLVENVEANTRNQFPVWFD